MQPLVTPELGNSSSQPSGGSPAVHSVNPPITFEPPLITSSAVDTALLYDMSAGVKALNATPQQNLQFVVLPILGSTPGSDLRTPVYTFLPVMTSPTNQSAPPISTVNQVLPM